MNSALEFAVGLVEDGAVDADGNEALLEELALHLAFALGELFEALT